MTLWYHSQPYFIHTICTTLIVWVVNVVNCWNRNSLIADIFIKSFIIKSPPTILPIIVFNYSLTFEPLYFRMANLTYLHNFRFSNRTYDEFRWVLLHSKKCRKKESKAKQTKSKSPYNSWVILLIFVKILHVFVRSCCWVHQKMSS